MQRIDCALPNRANASLTLINEKNQKIAPSMLENSCFDPFWKNPKMFYFRFNTPIPSQNQGQERIFKVRECAQSISRTNYSYRSLSCKNFEKKFFGDRAANDTPFRKYNGKLAFADFCS
jgi:hypothetical protein